MSTIKKEPGRPDDLTFEVIWLDIVGGEISELGRETVRRYDLTAALAWANHRLAHSKGKAAYARGFVVHMPRPETKPGPVIPPLEDESHLAGGPLDAHAEQLSEPIRYEWGYHSSDSTFVHVAKITGTQRDDLFDVTLYDRNYTDPDSGRNAEDQSLIDLRQLLGLANAALQAGLEPLPVADKEE